MATFTVPAGSNLTEAAESLGISLTRLLELNPQYAANPNFVRAGAVIEGESEEAAPAGQAPADPVTVSERPVFSTEEVEQRNREHEAEQRAIEQQRLQDESIAEQQRIETARIEREREEAAAEKAERQRNAFETLQGILGKYKLSSLESWAWEQIQNDVSVAGVELSLQDQQAFKDRFPAMAIRAENGYNAISPFEYLNWEDDVRGLFQRAGLPAGFYDSDDDYTAFIGGDVSPVELNDRIMNAYVRVANSSDEVRRAYSEFFGPSGDSALAAYHLDKDRAAPLLMEQAEQALIAGTGWEMNIDITQTTAAHLEDIGINQQQAFAEFRQLATDRSLFDETLSEGSDLRIEQEGVQSQFGLNSSARLRLDARRTARRNLLSGGGGAQVTGSGVIGLGSAR